MVYQSALTISHGMTSFSSAEEESTRYLEKNICSSYMSSGPVALVGSILYKGFYAATLRNNDAVLRFVLVQIDHIATTCIIQRSESSEHCWNVSAAAWVSTLTPPTWCRAMINNGQDRYKNQEHNMNR